MVYPHKILRNNMPWAKPESVQFCDTFGNLSNFSCKIRLCLLKMQYEFLTIKKDTYFPFLIRNP